MGHVEASALYQKTILAHSRAPKHSGILLAPERTLHGLNPLCGDEIWIYGRLTCCGALEASFESEGCSLCRASGSILLDALNGKSLPDVANAVAAFRDAFAIGKAPLDLQGDILALFDLRAYPTRGGCVLLAWETLASW